MAGATPWLLSQLFPELSEDEFRSEYWLGNRHLVAHGDPARLESLFAAPELTNIEALLGCHRGRKLAGFFSEADGYRLVYDLVASQARTLFQTGASIIFERVDHSIPAVDILSRLLLRELGVEPLPSSCSVFAGITGAGSPKHCDSKDNFALQLIGRKRWLIAPNHDVPNPLVNVWPWGDDGPKPLRKDESYTTVVMKPGSVLFFPRGYWHQTFIEEGPSMSLTVGIERPPAVRLLSVGLFNLLRQEPEWQAVTGAGWGTPAQEERAAESLRPLLASLANRLRDMDPRELIAACAPEPSPQTWTPVTGIELDGRSVRVAGGRSLAFEDDASADVARWMCGCSAPFSLASAQSANAPVARARVQQILRAMIDAGLLMPVIDLLPPTAI